MEQLAMQVKPQGHGPGEHVPVVLQIIPSVQRMGKVV